MPAIRGSGLPLTLGKTATNLESLGAGQTRVLPAGPLAVHLGQYSCLQYFDPVLNATTGSNAGVTGGWKICPRFGNGWIFVESDGANLRVANLSGCVVGAVLTNAGSGYTSPPLVTASAGGAQFSAIIGGLVNTVQTLPANVGSGYTIPPRLVISAPPPGGVQASGLCTISGGSVNAIFLSSQGAGYTSPPTATFVTDPNDTGTAIVPAGATVANIPNSMTLALTGAGTIAAVVMINPGLPQTAVPTLAFAGGGGTAAAATAIMNFSITGYTVSAGGTGFTAGSTLISTGGTLGVTPIHSQSSVELGIIVPRQAQIVPALAAGAIVASGTTPPLSVVDWGIGFQTAPGLAAISANGLPTAAATVTATVGGNPDVIYIQSFTG